MKPVNLLVCAVGLLLVADDPRGGLDKPAALGWRPATPDRTRTSSSARRLAGLVSDLRNTERPGTSAAAQSAGDLWLELSRLKQSGHAVKQIEWYVSDLEGSLRRGEQDATRRRHILNNLDYEVDALKRRAR